MGTKHHSSSDPVSDSKRRRRAGFSKIDPGIEANQCIKIYLASSQEEVDSPNCFQVDSVDLNHFFEDGGKIYGYQGLKITVWLSSITFHAYADISFESSSDGGKGITDLKSSLQNIFAENLMERKEDFLQTFSTECHSMKSIVSTVEILQNKVSCSSGNSNSHLIEESLGVEKKCGRVGYKLFIRSVKEILVFRVTGDGVGHLYSRLVPLVLLLVDGSNPIDVTDPRWEMYMLVQKAAQDSCTRLLGFAAVYHFHRYPDSRRLRLGQILIIPPYQRKGYGSILLKVLNDIAISDDVYDLTIEEPVDSLQHVRTCIDVQRLLVFEPIHQALDPAVSQLKSMNVSEKSQPCQLGPPTSIAEEVRKKLKINRRQFLQCWEILIYLKLDPTEKYLENFKIIISNRVKADVIGKESEGTGKRLVDIPTNFDQDMSFAMFKSQDGESTSVEKDDNQSNQEEQLKLLVEERMKEIKSVAQKMPLHYQ